MNKKSFHFAFCLFVRCYRFGLPFGFSLSFHSSVWANDCAFSLSVLSLFLFDLTSTHKPSQAKTRKTTKCRYAYHQIAIMPQKDRRKKTQTERASERFHSENHMYLELWQWDFRLHFSREWVCVRLGAQRRANTINDNISTKNLIKHFHVL